MTGPVAVARALGCGIVVTALLAGCGGSDQDRYCRTLESQREEIAVAVDEGGPTALLRVLPAFERLADDAPRDIAADWRQVVGALGTLDEALAEAGADPETYDRENPPDDVDPADRERIERAGDDLGDPRTALALRRIEQHALDVCQIPFGT